MLEIDLSNIIIREDMQEIFKRTPESEKLKGKSIYISGASGMIASYVVSYFIWLNEYKNYGIEIYAGIRKKSKAKARFKKYLTKKYFKVINKDVLEPYDDSLSFDYIIHAASLASPQYYGSNPVETMLPNVIGTYNLLEYSKTHCIEGLLFFSSGNVYGVIPDKKSINESDLGYLDFLDLGGKYGESKRCGEALCQSYCIEYNVPTFSARIYHTYGPTMDLESDKRVFAEFVNNVINDEDIVMKSNGQAIRQFSYMTDTVIGLLKILLCGKPGESYNVGNDNELLSIKQLADLMTSLYPEKGLQVIYKQRMDEGYHDASGNNVVVASTEKLRHLGWKPIHSARDGFKRTIEAIQMGNIESQNTTMTTTIGRS